MDKSLKYKEFYQDLTEGTNHCVMVGLPKLQSLTEFIQGIPEADLFLPENRSYGREVKPHITVLYGIQPVSETVTKNILSKIPARITATLGEVSVFENCSGPDGNFDVVKVDVSSPHLTRINEALRKTVEYKNDYPDYKPHVTIAYVKPGMGKKFVGENKFKGMKFLFEVFLYSNGSRDSHTAVPMLKEIMGLGQGGGYGGAAGGSIAAVGWAGTPSSAQTSNRQQSYDAGRTSYMQGNTVVNNSLYDTIRPEDLKHPKFSADEIRAGLIWEMKRMEFPDKVKAKPIVIKNLEKNPKYYSDLNQYFNSDKS